MRSRKQLLERLRELAQEALVRSRGGSQRAQDQWIGRVQAYAAVEQLLEEAPTNEEQEPTIRRLREAAGARGGKGSCAVDRQDLKLLLELIL
jgi:hypothetical protein